MRITSGVNLEAKL